MKLTKVLFSSSLLLLCAGCSGLVPYQVAIESSHPGTRIEANNDYVGIAPVTITIMGDKDGTFHGEGWYIIRGLPAIDAKGQNVQIKRFWRGGWFQPEASIPKRIYFDMTLPTDDDSSLNFNNSK
jgi:hypothetical protein